MCQIQILPFKSVSSLFSILLSSVVRSGEVLVWRHGDNRLQWGLVEVKTDIKLLVKG